MDQFNWPACVNKFCPSWSEALAKERGLDPIAFERLRERSWLGCCYVEKWKASCIAFPVCDVDGTAFRAHCRSPQRNGDGKWTWIYEPDGDQRPIFPLIFGNLEKAQRVYLFESQWDGVALVAILDLWEEIDTGIVAIVATRGAQYSKHLELLPWPKEPQMYAFPQADKAGLDWLEKVLSVIGGCYVVEVPQGLHEIKDLNDWIRDAHATACDIEAAIDHSIFQQAQSREECAQPNGNQQNELLEEFNEYPVAAADAFYGISGSITKIIEPQTEADPIAIQVQLLAAAGCAIGHGPYFAVGATPHHTNIFSCLVGRTSKGRKGSALDFVVWVMKEVDCPWVGTCLTSGLSSGEGLIFAVRDQLKKKEQVKKGGKYTGDVQEYIADFGIDDKRLFVTESEFSRPLKAMSRESNILSEVLRSAWDHGNLRSMVKNNPYHASNAHIAIVGHITREELSKSLLECIFFNGFSNRFLWLCVQRSKILPFGGELSLGDLYPEVGELKAAVEWARQVEEMERDQQANELWESVYGELTADMPGRFGATIGRGEGQVLRLSMIYALLDKSQTIRAVHLQAALALWKYCTDSARYLFLGSFDNPHAEKIFKALCKHPKGMTRSEINIEVFQRNLPKPKMSDALNYLRRLSLARCEMEHTAGRPSERWFPNHRKTEKEEYD
jgi:hypothetical protein